MKNHAKTMKNYEKPLKTMKKQLLGKTKKEPRLTLGLHRPGPLGSQRRPNGAKGGPMGAKKGNHIH